MNAETGALEKMKIEAFADSKHKDLKHTYDVMFNPATYSQKYEVVYTEGQAKGSTGKSQKFGAIKPQDYSFDFVFDGTGVSGPPDKEKGGSKPKQINVAEEIQKFLRTTGKLDGDTHRPPFLILSWGTLLVTCVLTSASIAYTLFKPNGDPLRAKISAVFAGDKEDALRIAEENKNSPDLTHLRRVQEGDNLPLMASRIYGDPVYYAAVARYNGLPDFRRLRVGKTLRFPPLKDLPPTAKPDEEVS